MPPTTQPLPELLQAKLEPLRELCERFGVVKLELFGSAARGEFDPAHSDLDFIVQMKGRREPGYASRFCDFADALELLYGQPVDLLTELMIKTPYFQASGRRMSHHTLRSRVQRAMASRAEQAQHTLNDCP